MSILIGYLVLIPLVAVAAATRVETLWENDTATPVRPGTALVVALLWPALALYAMCVAAVWALAVVGHLAALVVPGPQS